jgi:peptidoglycan/LPS O-acetylase OafA/YrhL
MVQDRLFGLDILRASAILFVVYAHLLYGFVAEYVSTDLLFILRLPMFDGVTIFFVLSGFLIGNIIIRKYEASKTLGLNFLFTFWSRRWIRTLPNYYLIVTITYFVVSPPEETTKLFSYIFFIQNFNTPHPAFFPEAWSLSVEEWFYLFFPLLIVTLHMTGISKRKVILITILIVILSCTMFRIYRALDFNELISLTEWQREIRRQVLTRLDAIGYGTLGAYLRNYSTRLWCKYRNSTFIIGLVMFVGAKLYTEYLAYRMVTSGNVYQFGIFENAFFFSVIPIATLLILPKLESVRSKGGVVFKIITWISVTSYSMYLLHLTPIITLLNRFVSSPTFMESLMLIPIYLVLVFAMSSALYWYFEKPVLSLRDRFLVNSK